MCKVLNLIYLHLSDLKMLKIDEQVFQVSEFVLFTELCAFPFFKEICIFFRPHFPWEQIAWSYIFVAVTPIFKLYFWLTLFLIVMVIIFLLFIRNWWLCLVFVLPVVQIWALPNSYSVDFITLVSVFFQKSNFRSYCFVGQIKLRQLCFIHS